MKKAFVLAAMMLIVGLMANVALTNETVPFPYWQHNYGLATFWSITNVGTTDSVVTINLFEENGDSDAFLASTTKTITAGACWQPDTQWSPDTWYQLGAAKDAQGFGNFEIVATEDQTYLWACVYADLGNSTEGGGGVPGYTIVMPGNPYGL